MSLKFRPFWLLGVAALGGGFWGAYRAMCAVTNPVLFINESPASKIYVNGKLFLPSNGTTSLQPWRSSYVVEVCSPRRTIRRTIYPLEPESDSGSVAVDKSGDVKFHLVSKE